MVLCCPDEIQCNWAHDCRVCAIVSKCYETWPGLVATIHPTTVSMKCNTRRKAAERKHSKEIETLQKPLTREIRFQVEKRHVYCICSPESVSVRKRNNIVVVGATKCNLLWQMQVVGVQWMAPSQLHSPTTTATVQERGYVALWLTGDDWVAPPHPIHSSKPQHKYKVGILGYLLAGLVSLLASLWVTLRLLCVVNL